ncbi:helix-turn-helix domain-containing protein [Nocardiopsis sp. EMB25]|uniref:sigma factor-like helix-turn-helix DNA-binding protein n=1 Tax=Nocardiopsis sp. EMB25 TaxID=2835867 RepID=UPI0022850052|nr:sigma factor-like helix-turn-helix DNA-binding protein [Nocardiopsis sp. EMB25]MCY9787145.1 helix-turn-helix domain-containing protein [Nocardiopsis sp. EMB25]
MDIDDMLTGVRQMPDQLATVSDPLTRARLVGDVLAAFAETERALKEVRWPAVVALREQGMTMREIGEKLGVSASRVDQISRGISG